MAILRYPENIGVGTGGRDWVRFKFYQYKSPFQNPAGGNTAYQSTIPQTPTGEEVALLMPQDIGSAFGGNWGGKDLTGVAQLALGTIGNAGGAALKGDFKQVKTNLENVFKMDTVKNAGGAGLADLLTYMGDSFSQLPGMGANLSANDALQLTTESIVNPNTELLYSGTGLRSHGYNFKMIAQSSTEADSILKIVEVFKKACAPKKNAPAFGGTFRNFIGIPDLCEVTFMNGSSENEYLPRYKLSGITSVNVSYVTDGNFVAYTDGKPLGVSLSLAFTETKLIFSEEIGTYR